MNKILYPRSFQALDPRLQLGVSAAWQATLLVASGYAVYLLFALLATNMNPVEATLVYASSAFLALDPIIATCVGGWILFAYLYSVAAIPAEAIDRGVAFNRKGFYAFMTLLVGLVLSLLPERIPFFARSIAFASLSESPASLFARREPPLRQPIRWLHGHHPPLVYE